MISLIRFSNIARLTHSCSQNIIRSDAKTIYMYQIIHFMHLIKELLALKQFMSTTNAL